MQHIAQNGNWTKDYFNPTDSNKLIGHTSRQTDYTYDVAGNMLTMPHLNEMVWDEDDEANAPDNIKDAAKGKEVKLSNYGNAPGGTVELDEKLLKGLYELSKDYKFSIQELAGASHSKNSTHYKGKAVDINWLNGKHVGANHPDAKKFIKAAKKLGFSVNNEWKMAKGAHFHMSIK